MTGFLGVSFGTNRGWSFAASACKISVTHCVFLRQMLVEKLVLKLRIYTKNGKNLVNKQNKLLWYAIHMMVYFLFHNYINNYTTTIDTLTCGITDDGIRSGFKWYMASNSICNINDCLTIISKPHKT